MTRYELTVTIFVLFLHYIADFVCQSDRVAKAKSRSWPTLTEHVFIYTAVLFGGMWIQQMIFAGGWYVDFIKSSTMWCILFALINGAAHFLIDAVTSRLSSYYYVREAIDRHARHNFWLVIGADQFLHTAILIYSLWNVSRLLI